MIWICKYLFNQAAKIWVATVKNLKMVKKILQRNLIDQGMKVPFHVCKILKIWLMKIMRKNQIKNWKDFKYLANRKIFYKIKKLDKLIKISVYCKIQKNKIN